MICTCVGLFVWDFVPFISGCLFPSLLWNFSAIILANTFSVPFSHFSLSENYIMRIWLCLIWFQSSLNQSSFIFFTVLLTSWVIFIILSCNSLVSPSASPILLLFPSSEIYIYTHTHMYIYIHTHTYKLLWGRGSRKTDFFFHIF